MSQYITILPTDVFSSLWLTLPSAPDMFIEKYLCYFIYSIGSIIFSNYTGVIVLVKKNSVALIFSHKNVFTCLGRNTNKRKDFK